MHGLSSTQQEIHNRALEVVRRFKQVEAELLSVLQEVQKNKIYLYFECTSLYDYAIKILKMGDNVAYSFISVSRKATEVPELKEAIESGELSVSKARKIVSVLTIENQQEWIAKAISLPQKKLEQEVAAANPKAATPEKMNFVSQNRLNLQMGISQNISEKLKRVQDLESQRLQRNASLEEILETMVDLYLEKNDPLKKAEKQLKKKESIASNQSLQPTKEAAALKDNAIKTSTLKESTPKTSTAETPLKSMSKASIEKAVFIRDQGRCTHMDDWSCKAKVIIPIFSAFDFNELPEDQSNSYTRAG